MEVGFLIPSMVPPLKSIQKYSLVQKAATEGLTDLSHGACNSQQFAMFVDVSELIENISATF